MHLLRFKVEKNDNPVLERSAISKVGELVARLAALMKAYKPKVEAIG